MRRNNQEKSTLKNNYQYNGIEHVPEFGLDWSMATYRNLMSDIGIWGGVDPKAELAGYTYSPYSWPMNNPITYNDPDGDCPVCPILIGAAIGVASNGVNNVVQDNNFFQGAGQAAAFGAIGGGISAGIGSAAQGLANAGASQFGVGAFQAGAHALSGGALSAAQGGSFWSGAAAGGFSSGVSSGISALGGSGFDQWLGGGLSGGVGSSLAGGSFWSGVGQGLLSAGLNHAAHNIAQGDPDPLKDNIEIAITLEEWAKLYKGGNYSDIAYEGTELLESKSGGNSNRYVIDPKTGNVIDMKHFLKIGRYGKAIGNWVERRQAKKGFVKSAHHPQDYFSNELGYKFYNSHRVKIWRGEHAYKFQGGFTNSVVRYLNNQ